MDFNGNDDGKPLPYILARQRVIPVFQKVVFLGVFVQPSRNCRPESRNMRSSFGRMDVIGKALFVCFKFFGIPKGRFNKHLVFFSLCVKDRVVLRSHIAGEVLYVRSDSSLEIKRVGGAFFIPCVKKCDAHARGKVGLLAQAGEDAFRVELDLFEYLAIGLKLNGCAGFIAFADFFYGSFRLPF